MAVVTFTEDIASPVPATRLFKAMIVDADNLLPKIVPQAIKSVERIEGDGGPGTIKQMNFTEGIPFKYVKLRIDTLDKQNLMYAYTLIEGDALMGKIESVCYEVKLDPSPDGGGCVGKKVTTYHTKPDVEISEEEIKVGKEMIEGIFKTAEAFLLANTGAYV